jgi:hypothetical protein
MRANDVRPDLERQSRLYLLLCQGFRWDTRLRDKVKFYTGAPELGNPWVILGVRPIPANCCQCYIWELLSALFRMSICGQAFAIVGEAQLANAQSHKHLQRDSHLREVALSLQHR